VLDGLPAEHQQLTRIELLLELRDQSRLADAGVTAEQY
jgi:hypothetical protein